MIRVSVICCLFIGFISGCGTNRVSLVDKNLVSVEKQGNKTVKILWTDVYNDGEDTVVYGAIQRRNHTCYPIKIHVDIAVVSPDGTILQESRTPDIYVARHTPGKGIDWTRFSVRLRCMPAQGSKVNMVVHSGICVQSDNNLRYNS
jgi:hypothetical protein